MQARFDFVEHLLLVGEAVGLEFGPDQLAVDTELEAAATAGDEFQVFDLLFECFEDFGRQTDGFRFVVSDSAVFERDVHGICPPYHRVSDSPSAIYNILGGQQSQLRSLCNSKAHKDFKRDQPVLHLRPPRVMNFPARPKIGGGKHRCGGLAWLR